MKRLLGIFAVSLCTFGPVAAVAGELAVLRVTGEARVSAVPDMARLQLGVRQDAKEAAAAGRAVAGVLSKVMGQLAEAGVDAKDMQTTQLSLSPQLDYSGSGAPKKLGYQAQSTLTVTLYDIQQIGGILDKALGAGATEFGGLSFDLSNRKELSEQAMQDAVKDARRDAMLLAEAAGMTLGEVTLLTHATAPAGPPIMMARGMADGAAMPVAAGKTEVHAQVQMEFELED